MTLKESGWQHQEGEGLQGWGGGSWGRTKCFGAVMAIGYEKRVGKIAAHCDLSLECYLRFWKESDYWCTWLLSVTFDCSCTRDYLCCLDWPETWDIYLRLAIFTWDLRFLLETWDFYLRLESYMWCYLRNNISNRIASFFSWMSNAFLFFLCISYAFLMHFLCTFYALLKSTCILSKSACTFDQNTCTFQKCIKSAYKVHIKCI